MVFLSITKSKRQKAITGPCRKASGKVTAFFILLKIFFVTAPKDTGHPKFR